MYDMTTTGDFDVVEIAKEFAPTLGNFVGGAAIGAAACYGLNKLLGQKADDGSAPMIGEFGTGKRLAVNALVGTGLALAASALSMEETPEVIAARALGVFSGATMRPAVAFAEVQIAKMQESSGKDSGSGNGTVETPPVEVPSETAPETQA